MSPPGRIDTEALLKATDLASLVGRYVDLKGNGKELEGLCPFHSERTPSFTVSPEKGFVHCFGCGAHHNAIGFLRAMTGCTFLEACEQLGHRDFLPSTVVQKPEGERPREGIWIPSLPVPDNVPDLVRDGGRTVPIWNPKRGKYATFRPSRADAYRDSAGRLLGYVLRIEFPDKKITPTVTWCIGPDGAQQWCIRPFPMRRPLCGLDDLAAKPDAPVLIVEGEKCRAAAAAALPMYAVVTWPGGSKGIAYCDWRPLAGRDVVLWPDADTPGTQAMLGWARHNGYFENGVAQQAHAVGARSIRMIDTSSKSDGWDIADALGHDGWTPKQLAVWASQRVVGVTVQVGQACP